jgi:thiol-disulfide isomerase/thioredoxin
MLVQRAADHRASAVRRTWASLAVLAVLVLAGCGSGSSDAPSASGERADFGFTATTLDGASFEGASLAGKPTVLWFWAPWCGTCRSQAPGVAQTATRFAGTVSVLGVAGLDGPAAMRQFVSSTGVGAVPHLSDEQGVVWKRFSVVEQSTFVLVDAGGRIVFRGSMPGGKLAERVAALVG